MKTDAETELFHIASLLDDDDSYIRAEVWKQLKARGKDVIPQLKRLALTCPADRCPMILLTAQTLEREWSLEELSLWVEHPMDDLWRGLFLVQQCVRPLADYPMMESLLGEAVSELCAEFTDAQTLLEKVKLFNYLFYHRLKFIPVDPFLKNADTAFVDCVIEKKTGNPIVLGLIYLLLAYRCGAPIRGIIFRGGFLPVVVDEQGNHPFYVNIFKNGMLFAPTQLDLFLKESGLNIPKESFRPAQVTDLAQLYAESLLFLFSMSSCPSDKENEEWMNSVMKCFPGERNLIIEEEEED